MGRVGPWTPYFLSPGQSFSLNTHCFPGPVMCFARRQLWSAFSSSNSRNEAAPCVDQRFWFPSCDWHSGEGLMLPAVLVVIAPSCLFKPDLREPKLWGWTWWGWTRWMRGGVGGRGTFGASGRPLRDLDFFWFLFLLSTHSFNLTRGSRERAGGGGGQSFLPSSHLAAPVNGWKWTLTLWVGKWPGDSQCGSSETGNTG